MASNKKSTSVAKEVAEKAKATAPQPSITDLLQALGGLANRPAATVPQVGIRNVSGNTVGIPPFGNEPGFQLFPFSTTDPNSMAIITYPRWQSLRKGNLYGWGMIERFDEILDETAARAPEDKAHECHPDHEKNKIAEPHVWITSKSDEELRKAILAITSESQLHRVLATVDEKLREIEQQVRSSGEQVVNPAERAIEDLPVIYGIAERHAQWRLEKLVKGTSDDILPKVDANRRLVK